MGYLSLPHGATMSKIRVKTIIGCLLVLVLSARASWSQANQTSAAEKAVAALELQWLEAEKINNTELLVPLLADKVVVTEADGTVNDRAQTLANYKQTKWESAGYKDLKVTVFGDTAIATGGFDGQGTDASGKPFELHERWTDTWVKMPSGRWQCVASHATPVKM
jgi:ketosteroid isomerase-like protein